MIWSKGCPIYLFLKVSEVAEEVTLNLVYEVDISLQLCHWFYLISLLLAKLGGNKKNLLTFTVCVAQVWCHNRPSTLEWATGQPSSGGGDKFILGLVEVWNFYTVLDLQPREYSGHCWKCFRGTHHSLFCPWMTAAVSATPPVKLDYVKVVDSNAIEYAVIIVINAANVTEHGT